MNALRLRIGDHGKIYGLSSDRVVFFMINLMLTKHSMVEIGVFVITERYISASSYGCYKWRP